MLYYRMIYLIVKCIYSDNVLGGLLLLVVTVPCSLWCWFYMIYTYMCIVVVMGCILLRVYIYILRNWLLQYKAIIKEMLWNKGHVIVSSMFYVFRERDVPILFYIVLFPVVCTVVRLMLFLLLNDAHTNTFHFGNELLIGEWEFER